MPGSFWENRGDRHHCGIDIYALDKSAVFAILNGTVCTVGLQTSPAIYPYWKTTYYVLIRHSPVIFAKYAEMEAITVRAGESVRECQHIGRIGPVLDLTLIDAQSPPYIRDLGGRRRDCMLHLEIYSSFPEYEEGYRGGNWFGEGMPRNLCNPAEILQDAKRGEIDHK